MTTYVGIGQIDEPIPVNINEIVSGHFDGKAKKGGITGILVVEKW